VPQSPDRFCLRRSRCSNAAAHHDPAISHPDIDTAERSVSMRKQPYGRPSTSPPAPPTRSGKKDFSGERLRALFALTSDVAEADLSSL
jgi:hypothetical protein